MDEGELIVFQLIIPIICAVIAGMIASSKGRSVVGWAIGGFFLGLIGIIILACLGNLKEKQAQLQRAERERRRMREQLRQERQKTESFRQYSSARLDSHDQTLGVDTRSVGALPGASHDPRRALTDDGSGSLPLADAQGGAMAVNPAAPANEALWYYAHGDQAQGPIAQAELRQLIQSRTVDPATMVWTEGYSDWVRADQVPALGAG